MGKWRTDKGNTGPGHGRNTGAHFPLYGRAAADKLLDCHSVVQVPFNANPETLSGYSFTIRPPYVVYHLFSFLYMRNPFELRAAVTGESC